MKDAFEIGRELKEIENIRKQKRIETAITIGLPESRHWNAESHHITIPERLMIAHILQQAVNATGETQTKEETLDMFCWLVFGCSFEETVQAYEYYKKAEE